MSGTLIIHRLAASGHESVSRDRCDGSTNAKPPERTVGLEFRRLLTVEVL
jgi:hypothetical protein